MQYLLDTQQYSAFEMLKSKFKGNYARMSMQKFSSNVVEKCLRVFDDGGRKMIVSELLSVSSFDLLMQDPFANYVIQCALVVCKVSFSLSFGLSSLVFCPCSLSSSPSIALLPSFIPHVPFYRYLALFPSPSSLLRHSYLTLSPSLSLNLSLSPIPPSISPSPPSRSVSFYVHLFVAL